MSGIKPVIMVRVNSVASM